MREIIKITTIIGSGVLASACCIVPFAVALVGVGGSALMLANALAPWRPLFVAVAFVALGLGWWQVRKRAQECADGSCTPRSWRRSRVIMAIITAITVPLLAFPELTAWASGSSASEPGAPTVTLALEGMTCEACASHVRDALTSVPGVQSAKVTFRPPRANIRTEGSVSLERLIAAIEAAGYRASVIPRSERTVE